MLWRCTAKLPPRSSSKLANKERKNTGPPKQQMPNSTWLQRSKCFSAKSNAENIVINLYGSRRIDEEMLTVAFEIDLADPNVRTAI